MQRQLRVQRANLLAVTICRDRHDAIYVSKLRRFQQRQCRDGFSCGKLKGIRNQRVVLISADFYLVGVRFAVIGELSLYVGFSDQSI